MSSCGVFICLGCQDKIPKFHLNNKSLSSGCRDWEIQDQGAGQFTPCWGQAAFFLAGRWAPSPWVLMWWRENKRALVFVPCLIRTLALLDEGPTLMTSFNLNYFLLGRQPFTHEALAWNTSFPRNKSSQLRLNLLPCLGIFFPFFRLHIYSFIPLFPKSSFTPSTMWWYSEKIAICETGS